MARPNTLSDDSDDELPELAVLIKGLALSKKRRSSADQKDYVLSQSEPHPAFSSYPRLQSLSTEAQSLPLSPQKGAGKISRPSKQHMQSSISNGVSNAYDLSGVEKMSKTNEAPSIPNLNTHQHRQKRHNDASAVSLLQNPRYSATRRSPARKAKQRVNYYRFGAEHHRSACVGDPSGDENDSFTDLSGFIVDDKAEINTHDIDLEDDTVLTACNPSPSQQTASIRLSSMHQNCKQKLPRRRGSEDTLSDADHTGSLLETMRSLSLNTAPSFPSHSLGNNESPRQSRHPSRGEKAAFSQPTQNTTTTRSSKSSPSNTDEHTRCSTPPPPSPSKSRLNSPSKKKAHDIPCSPRRASIDTFWSSEVVNDWHEQYSPRKTPGRGRGIARFLIRSDEDSPSERYQSPSRTKSRKLRAPASKGKMGPMSEQEAKKIKKEKRKVWDAEKSRIAYDMILDLDKQLFNLDLTTSLAHLGGIEVKWSKTLSKTSGRANRVIDRNGRVTSAYIELAEKIVDRPERLVQTLAHEFCHMGVYFLYGHGVQPHGKEFWELANKVVKWFSHHPNPLYCDKVITTRHMYEIEYKYKWMCTGAKTLQEVQENSQGCGMQYGRHTKSIDVMRRRCGRCFGVLLQIDPPMKKSELSKMGYFTTASKEDEAPLPAIRMPPPPLSFTPMLARPTSPFSLEYDTARLAAMTAAMTRAAETGYSGLPEIETMSIYDEFGGDYELDMQPIEAVSGPVIGRYG